jgi:tetratricopeptide (TPR) repeat protein
MTNTFWIPFISRFAKSSGCALVFVLLISPYFFLSGEEQPDLSSYSSVELLGRANRSFSMRNFLASERYFRELDQRLTHFLSQQVLQREPQESLTQITIDEELILAPFGLGHTLIFLHKYNEAAEQLEKGLKLYPDWAINHIEMPFFKDPSFTGPVVNDLLDKIRISGDSVASLLLGYIQFFSGDYPRAHESFSRALKKDPRSTIGKLFLENISLASGQDANSSRPQPFPEKSDEVPSEELISYGNSFFRNSEFAMAASYYKKAIERGQEISEAHIAYGDSLFALGKFEEATQAIVKGLEINPDYVEKPVNRRDFYRNPVEFDRQLQSLEGFVRSHPSNLDARFLLGYNYFFIQDYSKANKQFQAVLISKTLNSPAQLLRRTIQQLRTSKPK